MNGGKAIPAKHQASPKADPFVAFMLIGVGAIGIAVMVMFLAGGVRMLYAWHPEDTE